jgi:hypothetical protein
LRPTSLGQTHAGATGGQRFQSLEMQDMGCTGALNSSKSLALIQSGCIRIVGTQTDTPKVFPRGTQKHIQERASYAPIAQRSSDVQPPNAPYTWVGQKRIPIQSADRNENASIEIAIQRLARGVEAILSVYPLAQKRFEKLKPFFAGFCLHLLQTWHGKLDLLYQDGFILFSQ